MKIFQTFYQREVLFLEALSFSYQSVPPPPHQKLIEFFKIKRFGRKKEKQEKKETITVLDFIKPIHLPTVSSLNPFFF